MIRATLYSQKPKNGLEEIICDADLDYLGKEKVAEVANRLFLELKERGIIEREKEWDELQLSFLEKHRYFSNYSIKNREPGKLAYLQGIKEKVAS